MDRTLKKKGAIESYVRGEIDNEVKVAKQCKYTFKIACSNLDAYDWYKKEFPGVIVEWVPWFRGKQKFPWGD
ncbi:MAG: hypothetical protein HC935_00550 [Pseudanabaena sp. SU_2_4]|nr:hypothetical protein [Pseudanabaena sp. SU_2_4]